MKRILFLLCLSLISFASECRAMNKPNNPIDEVKLSRRLKRLFIASPTSLQLELDSESESESEPEPQSSQEEYTASPWQDESLMAPQPYKENLPPKPYLNEKQITHFNMIAKFVDEALEHNKSTLSNKSTLKNTNSGLKRNNAFYLPR